MPVTSRTMAFAAALVAIFWLTGFLPSKKASADAIATRNCKMDAIKQSVCIYQAILEDVDKNYSCLLYTSGIGPSAADTTSTAPSICAAPVIMFLM